jgi:hypothetical protein
MNRESRRGNVVRVARWNVGAINDFNQAQQNFVGYNRTGAAVFQRDHLGAQTSLSYGDSFSDQINRNTFAYPVLSDVLSGANSQSREETSENQTVQGKK